MYDLNHFLWEEGTKVQFFQGEKFPKLHVLSSENLMTFGNILFKRKTSPILFSFLEKLLKRVAEFRPLRGANGL